MKFIIVNSVDIKMMLPSHAVSFMNERGNGEGKGKTVREREIERVVHVVVNE